jgi:hypothetical protein
MEGQPPKTLHYTELTPAEPDEPLATECNVYVREVGRLLAEGHEGKHILIKGEEIIGIYPTEREASDEGYRRYLLSGFMVAPIQTWQRVYRVPHLFGCKYRA